MKLKIIPIPAYQDNYIWILHNDVHAVVVDPGLAAPVKDYLIKLKLNKMEAPKIKQIIIWVFILLFSKT